METLTVSLNKAQKLLTKLKQKNMRPNFNGSFSFVLPGSSSNIEILFNNVQNKARDMRQSLEDYLAVQDDMAAIKEAIFQKNQETGISKKMSDMERLNSRIKAYSTILDHMECAETDALPLEKIELSTLHEMSWRMSAENSQRVIVLIQDAAALKAVIQALRSKVNELEDEIMALNASTKVTLSVSPVTKALLGL